MTYATMELLEITSRTYLHYSVSVIRCMRTVSAIEGLPDAEARTDRGEGEGHDGNVLRAGQGQPTAGGHAQAQEHLPQPRRGGLRGGPGASQADKSAAKNVGRAYRQGPRY